MRFMTIAAAATVLCTGAAQAALLDFVAEAAGNERGVEDGTVITFNGLDVTFSAGPGGLGSDFAYFDDLSSGRPAGLGVCTTLNAAKQCRPSDDDNVHFDESVTLSFGETVTLKDFVFYDAKHFLLDSASLYLDVAVNGGDVMKYSFADLVMGMFEDVDTITFAGRGEDGAAFYIGSAIAAVPVPAAGLMLLGALGGLGLARRRSA